MSDARHGRNRGEAGGDRRAMAQARYGTGFDEAACARHVEEAGCAEQRLGRLPSRQVGARVAAHRDVAGLQLDHELLLRERSERIPVSVRGDNLARRGRAHVEQAGMILSSFVDGIGERLVRRANLEEPDGSRCALRVGARRCGQQQLGSVLFGPSPFASGRNLSDSASNEASSAASAREDRRSKFNAKHERSSSS